MENKLQTNISPDYVKGWDTAKAIRELIQNYLDSRQEFGCDGYLKWEDGRAIIKDYGPGLELKHFAMGVSEKSVNAKGKYGEGLKLALLTMARTGVPVELWTNGNVIRPVIEYNHSFQTELLAFELEPLSYESHKGTTIKFECAKEEFECGKSYFIEFFKRGEKAFEWLVPNKISLPGGYVFVNGTRVGELKDSLYSYHLEEEEVGDIGNRDREVIDMDSAISAISEMIAACASIKVIEGILRSIKSGAPAWEAQSLRVYSWQIDGKNQELWVKASNEVFGANAVFSSGDSKIDNQAEYMGYRIIQGVGWTWRNVLEDVDAIPSAAKVLKGTKLIKAHVAQRDLDPEEKQNLAYAKRMVKKYYAKDVPLRVSIIEQLALNSGSVSQRVKGVWDPHKKMILIDREVLGSAVDAFFVLLHEAVHQVTGFNDCTAEFEQALLDIGVRALIELEKGGA